MVLKREHKRICIWSPPRTASTFVYHYLIKHLQNENWLGYDSVFTLQNTGSEPFRPTRPDYYKTFQAFQREPSWVAKLHNSDIINLESLGLFKSFVNLCDYNILLLRKDLFETTVSFCISKIKNQWIYQDDIPIKISRRQFAEAYHQQVKFKNDLINSRINFNKKLYTENLPDKDKLWSVLTGLEPKELEYDEWTSISPDKTKVVINYNELKDFYDEMRTSR